MEAKGTAGDIRFDYFIAHAGADAPKAIELYELLTVAGLRVFLDVKSLQPGDLWDDELPRAMAASAATIVLVSSNLDDAWYGREEIADAVELARHHDRRIIPVYLEKIEPKYGLRRVHSLFALTDQELGDAARRLIAQDAHPQIAHAGGLQILSDRIPPVSKWFAGREAQMARLRDSLADKRAIVTSVTGMGGVGKTTLAAAYARQRSEDMDVVWWVRCAEPVTLVDDLLELADALEVPENEDGSLRAKQAVQSLARNRERTWLIVFDNVNEADEIAPWLPDSQLGEVVITSRFRHLDEFGTTINVAEFDEPTAAQFLVDRVAGLNIAAAGDIDGARIVGVALQGLPLALEQAGAYVAHNPARTWVAYHELFLAAVEQALPNKFAPRTYEETALTTWTVSIKAADEEAPGASNLLSVLSHYSPDAGIPLDLILSDEGAAIIRPEGSPLEVEESLDALYAYSLVRLEPGLAWIHRLVQAAVSRDLAARSLAIRCLGTATPADASHPASWPQLKLLLPHALEIRDRDSVLDPDDFAALGVSLNGIGTYLRSSGAAQEAIAIEEQLVEDSERILGPDHPDTIAAQKMLAKVINE